MSIQKQNTVIPDTLRTFVKNTDKFKETESLFLTPTDFVCTTDNFSDADFWYDNLGINIFPLHNITQFNPEDRKPERIESLQDFSYESVPGKYIQRIKYDWTLDYHNLINEISGGNVNIIYASGKILRATLNDAGNVKGFSMSSIEVDDILFNTNDSNGTSELFLEWLDNKELNESGYEVEVDWQPKRMDRRVLNISLSFAPTTITMAVKYLNENILGIQASDITITDQKNGNITFGVFIPGNGIYQLGDFSDKITHACLYIQSTIYIGAKRFTFKVVIEVINNMIWGDDNNMIWANGENMIFAKN